MGWPQLYLLCCHHHHPQHLCHHMEGARWTEGELVWLMLDRKGCGSQHIVLWGGRLGASSSQLFCFPDLPITCSCTPLSVHTHKPLCVVRPIPTISSPLWSLSSGCCHTLFSASLAIHINHTVSHRNTNSSTLSSIDSLPDSLLSQLSLLLL